MPTTDTRNMEVGGNLRPIPVIEPAKEVADSRHAWWPIVAGLPSGEGQYRERWRELVRFRMPSGLDGYANLFL